MTCALILFAVMGALSGFTAQKVYCLACGENCNRCTWVTALLFPGASFGCFFVIDIILWVKNSSGAIPFGTMLLLLAMWFGISVPLCKLGAFWASKGDPVKPPTKVSSIAREIPFQQWYNHWMFTIPLGGALPFGALFLELSYIYSSVWMSRFYYLFGFLGASMIVLLLTCAQATIVLLYFQLTAEDHNWWWRSFFTGGSTAIYAFVYSCYLFLAEVGPVTVESAIVYALYLCLIYSMFFLLVGAVGFLSCLWFVWKIYAACKSD